MIVNRSDFTYNLSTALNFDFNVGYAQDDYIGCIPEQSIFYSYNSDSLDGRFNGSDYFDTIPAVGVKVFNRKLGKFIGYRNFGPTQGIDYFNEADYINFMKGRWADGTPIKKWNNGHDPASSDSTNFLFPGDPRKDNEWSMRYPFPGQDSLIPSILPNSLGIVEPVVLGSGERFQLDFVVGAGIDSSNTNYLDNIDVLVENLNKAARFQQGVDSIAPKFTYSSCTVGLDEKRNISEVSKRAELYLYPNPSNGELNIIANQSMERIVLFDLQGRIAQTIKLDQAQEYYSIKLNEDLPNGMYIVRGITPDGNSLSERLLLQR
jgi:hypothetical protein